MWCVWGVGLGLGGAGGRCGVRPGTAAHSAPHRPPHRPPLPPLDPPQDPKDRDRVDRECRVMRHLSNHVCIVRLLEHVETPGYVYIMMEAARRG